ncbi:MAG: hypothetical protein ABIP48_25045, partial [Planctomycetota bacterium]
MARRKPILQPLLLGATLALGFEAAWATLVLWCVAMVDQASQSDRIYEQILVQIDGTPVIESYT